MTLRFGYGSNGFGSHRLDDALAIIADLGYDGVALTMDQPHLDPAEPGLARRTAALAGRLDRLGLSVVVETGARYVLDPWHKHEPTLVSAQGRQRRVDFLKQAVRVAADLDAEAMSFWSGTLPPGTSADLAWQRLADGVASVLEEAAARDVWCAFEPEPGMFVERADDVTELRRRLGDPERLRVTVDLGHCVCVEDRSADQVIRDTGGLLANVQVDDMHRGVHEHLELGEGELDLPAALASLLDCGYTGLAAMELPRHGHAAPAVAARSLTRLREALAAAERDRARRSQQPEARVCR